MKETRQDAWTKEEDDLLAETVLQYIRNGNTQLEAFKEVAAKLARTPAACGFRWNATIRKQYESAISYAKEERKKISSQALRALQTTNDPEKNAIESAIQLLEKLKSNVSEEMADEQAKIIEGLQKENQQLLQQVQRYQNAWAEMEKLWQWVNSSSESKAEV
ncbi:RsfA family transcriptional regulator [Oceanobacillus luteolus]|uniref:RsfA family transcriptional regulator n=1 Tax=Oceanobacillus luteolus TaxID=1274358 RepID=A0ABW4HRA6_9BACI|nr:RsfA family transcriptional regulator [Oceanobacillus luteolus]MCM3739145.1 RsfA family transcriptional regulator [Oceanobacillus luteolus]